jgi:hypothetical protein
MSRPVGSKNKKTLALLASQGASFAPPQKEDKRTDAEIIEAIRERFDEYLMYINGTQESGIHALIVSGSAGIGKSYTAEWGLEELALKNGLKYIVVKGLISAIDLYELAYMYREEGQVIVLDDADSIFDDQTGLNLLKSLLDTSTVRKVCWMTDHPKFKGNNATLPKQFQYKGSMIFLTNKNFQDHIDFGGPHVEHMKALMSRAIYLDLRMHSRREVSLWARHLIVRNHILVNDLSGKGKITEDEEKMLMDWIIQHMDEMREVSIRTALKLGLIFKSARARGKSWEASARMALLRGY